MHSCGFYAADFEEQKKPSQDALNGCGASRLARKETFLTSSHVSIHMNYGAYGKHVLGIMITIGSLCKQWCRFEQWERHYAVDYIVHDCGVLIAPTNYSI